MSFWNRVFLKERDLDAYTHGRMIAIRQWRQRWRWLCCHCAGEGDKEHLLS
jgi:hypothetical protein